jgi:hypothetical protein
MAFMFPSHRLSRETNGDAPMIRYDLRCSKGHAFDAWFRGSEGYEAERAAGRVLCAICGDSGVEKALMAPAVAASRDRPSPPVPAPAGDAPQASAAPALSAPPEHPLHRALTALRSKLEREAEYVGDRFAAEARRMHEGETETKAIWGEATLADAKALLEDGAPVAPLPPLPKRNG